MTDHRDDWPDGMVPREWANPEVHAMRCTALVAGQNAMFNGDLVFIKGVPYAVFEWEDYEDGAGSMAVPSAVVQLDPKFLKPLSAEWAPVRWLYEMPLQDPRQMH